MILETIGTPGLSGLDKLISFFIVVELQALIQYIEKCIRNKTWAFILTDCEDILSSLNNTKGMNLKRKYSDTIYRTVPVIMFLFC